MLATTPPTKEAICDRTTALPENKSIWEKFKRGLPLPAKMSEPRVCLEWPGCPRNLLQQQSICPLPGHSGCTARVQSISQFYLAAIHGWCITSMHRTL